VRKLLASGLERLGYRVMQAGSGPEALALSEKANTEIALVVTDLIMADMSGLDLARLLRAARPRIRALYVTGYTDNPAVLSQLPETGTLLEKPFRLDQLARQVRLILDRPTDPAHPPA
jgi:CheY-like chemotaxis protein